MIARPNHLRLVDNDSAPKPAPEPVWGDLALMGSLLVINTIPVVGELVRPGHWGQATVGFATLCVVLTGRELVSQVRDLRRAGA